MTPQTDEPLLEWLTEIDRLEAEPWERLPELELYMDQVITLMGQQLAPVSVESDRPLTPNMINNYVKDEVMPRPVRKKYDREHLTALLLICMLKSVFPLPQIRELLEGLSRYQTSEQLFNAFQSTQKQALRRAAGRLSDVETMDEARRFRLAMELALEANADRVAASRLLESVVPPAPEKPKKEKKEKSKKDAPVQE